MDMTERFTYKGYTYYNEDELPKLVYGIIHHTDTDQRYSILREYNPQHISVQCGGYLCDHIRMEAIELSPTPFMMELMKILDEKYLDSNITHGFQTIDTILKYETYLKDFGLTCNYSHNLLTEAFYPIDFPENPSAYFNTTGLKDSQEMIEPVGDGIWNNIFFGKFTLAIVGNNCD